MAAPDVVLAGGMRTPFGDFGRSLKGIELTALGIHAAKACLKKASLDAGKVDHLVFGNCVPVDSNGYFASRFIALESGMPEDSCGLNVSRACGSGSRQTGFQPRFPKIPSVNTLKPEYRMPNAPHPARY